LQKKNLIYFLVAIIFFNSIEPYDFFKKFSNACKKNWKKISIAALPIVFGAGYLGKIIHDDYKQLDDYMQDNKNQSTITDSIPWYKIKQKYIKLASFMQDDISISSVISEKDKQEKPGEESTLLEFILWVRKNKKLINKIKKIKLIK
jgi:hypothetical protein